MARKKAAIAPDIPPEAIVIDDGLSRQEMLSMEKELLGLPEAKPLGSAVNNVVNEEDIIKQNADERKSGASALFEDQNIDLKTELTQHEILRVAQLRFMSSRYHMQGVDAFLDNFLRLKVSKDRRGRGEFIQGLHAEERREKGADLSPLQALFKGFGG